MRYLSAGESHGQKLTVILDGYPAGVYIDPSFVQKELIRRKVGYGRGLRMQIEDDKVNFTSGIRFSETTGAPITMEIENKDFKNWIDVMSPFAKYSENRAIYRPRPGHADLAGMIKYERKDIRDILERASARETALKVAVGSLSKILLAYFNIKIYSVVWEIGGKGIDWKEGLKKILNKKEDIEKLHNFAEKNDLRMPLRNRKEVYNAIDMAKKNGDSLGGVFSVVVKGVPIGLGSHIQYDKRLDSKLSSNLMSIPAIKAVSIGGGVFSSELSGKNFQDAIYLDKKGVYRKTNFSGGIEGGISNGEDIIVTCFMKPIPTLLTPLPSLNFKTCKAEDAVYERSDVTAVPACSVVAEAVAAFTIADAFTDKFGKDTITELKRNYTGYKKMLAKLWKKFI
ncbi:MAG: chorismate synthase [Proteobacteria bacterium]|nr:chorismate synthase [Pseudomonadota bacterium]